jgi:flavin reductase (DIM6/NTAB) family NADH-FMN oxidoreductase RutF
MADEEFTERGFRDTMALFASGVTIITVAFDGEVHGMTANAIMSVSLDPPLLAVAVDNRSHTKQLLDRAGHFGVNVLAEGQSDQAMQFARARVHGQELFGEAEIRFGPGGDPLIAGSLTHIACTVASAHLEGDHTLYIGRVTALDRPRITADPLVFYRGRFSATACHSCVVRQDPIVAYFSLHEN